MKDTSPYFVLISLLLINFSTALAQANTGVRFEHISVNEGLSQNSVRCLMQDHKGFMWFGTEEGLNRYDGYGFQVFQNRANDITSLSANDTRSILEDRDGFIWVGTTHGLNILNRQTNTFDRVVLPGGNQNSAKRNFIYSLYEDKDGDIWIGTLQGFYLFRKAQNTYEYFGEILGEKASQVMSFLHDRNGAIWIGTEHGLYQLNKQDWSIVKYRINPNRDPMRSISSILEDQQGKLWVGTYSGLFKSQILEVPQPGGRQYDFKRLELQLPNFESYKDMIRCMVEAQNGAIWIGTFDGLVILDPIKESVVGVQHQEGFPRSLSANFIRSIGKDKRGDIWLGTIMGGVNIFHANDPGFYAHLSDWARSGMEGKIIHAFFEDERENLWVSSRDGGISYIDRAAQKITNYKYRHDTKDGLSINEARHIMVDQYGEVWIATYFGGVNRLDPKTGKFKHYLHDDHDPHGLSADNQNMILEDSRGDIWIATHGGGLDRYVREEDNFIHFRHDPDNEQSLSGDIIVSLYEDSDQQLWIATRHSGLNRMDLRTGKITRFRHHRDQPFSISSDAVTNIIQDSQGIIWVGTEDAGLNRLDPETWTFTNYRKTDGLPSDAIHGILEDDKGKLWLSTNKGISQFDPKEESFINYDQTDGLENNQFIRNAFLKTKRGEMLFGGINGFSLFKPENIQRNDFIPKVVITGFQLFNKEADIGKKGSPLGQHISETTHLELKNNQSVFSFDFVALSYLKASKNQYAYQLEGLDETWNYIGQKRNVDFTTLPPGDYTFKVKASNNSGLWNELSTDIKITVLPPWYKTAWAYFIYSLIFIGLLLIYRNYSLLRLREKHKLKLTQIEKEKAEEITALKLRFFTDISHELRTPLSLILGPIEKISELARGQSQMENYLSVIKTNGEYLLKLINELMDFRKVEAGKMNLKLEKADLALSLNSMKNTFKERAAQSQTDFQVICPLKTAPGLFDVDKLQKIWYNLLSNAFKFTANNPEGRVVVKLSSVEADHQSLYRITVADNGMGIAEDDLEHLFQPFFQGQKGNKDEVGTGIGLSLTKRLVELHDGRISVKSRIHQGTTFTIDLPANPIGEPVVDEVPQAVSVIEETVEPAILQPASVEPSVNSSTDNDFHLKPLVLLAEDNTQMRNYLVDCLEEDYRVIAVADGQKGWEKALAIQPDIIITDMMMPMLDGVEFCNKLKNDIHTSHIPVVFLTARTSLEHRIKGIMTGADAYLTKPFSHQHLGAVIRNLLNNRKQLWKAFKTGNYSIRAEKMLSPLDQRFMDQIYVVAETHLKNAEFNVEQFAREMRLSRSYFHRKLKVLTGCSASEFMRQIRLKKAVFLMAENELTITEIAYEVGFSSPNYFGRCFRKKYGVCPTEYKEQMVLV